MMKRGVTGVAMVVVAVSVGFVAGAGGSVGTKASKTAKAEKALIADHVPPALADSCEGNTADTKKGLSGAFPDNKANNKRLVASVQCVPFQGPVDSVTYMQFKTVGAMARTYEAILGFYPLETNTAETAEGTCPIEGQYGDESNPTGRVGCVPATAENSAHILWSTDKSKILAEGVLVGDTDGSVVRSFFASDDAGPV